MENRTPRKILSKFYKDNKLDNDGGQKSASVKIELTPRLHFYFPNFDSRRRALVKHDIHHLLTGYETTVSGESEISAWEIASGCRSYRTAFLINTSGMMMGSLVNFSGVVRAFSRGRKTKNLYHDKFTTDQALDMNVDELRSELFLDKHTKDSKPTFTDFTLFFTFFLFAIPYSIVLSVFLPFVLFYTLYTVFMTKKKATGAHQ
jgi:ubiquinone biosynthesis protein Coq4